MSKMIPRETIDVLRDYVDISLSSYGIDCTLYIPTNTSTVEKYDVFAKPSDFQYNKYTGKVFIEWNPSTYRLKKLGVFVEDLLPILVWFGNKALDEQSQEVEVDILIGSYFEIEPEFIPSDQKKIAQFELVNSVIKGMHDAVIYKGFSAVPRRVQT